MNNLQSEIVDLFYEYPDGGALCLYISLYLSSPRLASHFYIIAPPRGVVNRRYQRAFGTKSWISESPSTDLGTRNVSGNLYWPTIQSTPFYYGNKNQGTGILCREWTTQAAQHRRC